MSRRTLLLAAIVVLFAIRNLPWHLDDFDQAKQAMVSAEMIGDGHWWFQHTPAGRVATKPPLAGWISAGIHALGVGWEFAWRLPSFASALVLLAMLWRSGRTLAGSEMGALIAAGAFSLNLLAPRLATLVRTDMLLTLFIFLAGWLVSEKIRTAQPWTTRERWALFAAVLASMLTKGPIAYLFLFPGLAAYVWIARRRGWPRVAWAGAWPWFAPLALFGVWVGVGVWLSPEFYEQVVQREFLGRLTVGEKAVHTNQPPWFYLLHLLHKWGPWSIALVALLWQKRVRATLRAEPQLVWLACWAAGGLLLMSLVPSKRPDRIFPVIPPLCLLLAGLWASRGPHAPADQTPADSRWLPAVIAIALLTSGGYAGWRVVDAFRADARALVRFGAQARALAGAHPERLAIVKPKDEGMILYADRLRFISLGEAEELWHAGEIDWLLLDDRDFKNAPERFQPHRIESTVPRLRDKKSAYHLLQRVERSR